MSTLNQTVYSFQVHIVITITTVVINNKKNNDNNNNNNNNSNNNNNKIIIIITTTHFLKDTSITNKKYFSSQNWFNLNKCKECQTPKGEILINALQKKKQQQQTNKMPHCCTCNIYWLRYFSKIDPMQTWLMVDILTVFCLHSNQAHWHCSWAEKSKEYFTWTFHLLHEYSKSQQDFIILSKETKVTKAHLNADVRILKCHPFFA